MAVKKTSVVKKVTKNKPAKVMPKLKKSTGSKEVVAKKPKVKKATSSKVKAKKSKK